MSSTIVREQVLAFRVRAQQLDRESGTLADTAVLDAGVQDTGPDGALWALAIRGVDVASLDPADLAVVWTLRGAPHAYRRADLPSVAAAVEPFSEADAGKRIFDASRPLREAGIGNREALDAVAAAMGSIVDRPMVKGEVSTRLTAVMDPPYLRFCRPCNATHLYEMPFRLAALRAGLELQAGTSPPVLRAIPGFRRQDRPAVEHEVVRGSLRLLGPVTPKQVAEFVDAPVRDVRSRWPDDAVEVSVDGETRWVLDADRSRLTAGPARVTRLLGPFDLFLQARDRRLIVREPDRAKALWPVLGRPGAVLVDGEIVGTWRPRASGRSLRVGVEPWTAWTPRQRTAVAEQAERLASHRGVRLAGVDGLD
ncbi:MAG: winged helix DNA-binding domain-containing protein [Actinomycetales bacterium]|nr:winged helix DNA-binding domain-containing protein [Actinomycetales bacterium]